jgi:hypothetical protein
VIDISEPCCFNSLNDRVIIAKKNAANDGNGDEGGQLKLFKLNRGMKLNLFDDLFVVPSDLQTALLVPPRKRLESHLETIASTLRMFPALRELSSSSVIDLAEVVEYRT